MGLITELKRRGVIKVAAAYGLASWILIEAGSVLLPTFGAPEGMFRWYVILVLLGFVVSLLAAWFFQITADGVHLDHDGPGDDDRPPSSGGSHRLNFIMVAMLIVALGISLTLNISGFRGGFVADIQADEASSIAVLPFSNIGNDPDNLVFIDGIHDDLLTKLANVESMRVISRTSVMAYRDSTKNLREIGAELGVSSVLEGSVRRIGDNVRINMQLIDARSDEHLWAETFDRALTAKNIFAIQSEISTQVATALKATLSADEWQRLLSTPTENIDAYRLVISGRQNLHQRLYETLLTARQQFEQAIELDPNYAGAYVGLADSILLLHINHNAIPAEQAYEAAQNAINQALQLNPQQADAFASQGLLFMRKAQEAYKTQKDPESGDLVLAEENYQRALKLNPSNASAWMWYSSLSQMRRDLSKALEYNQKSLALDPLGRIPYLNIAKLQGALNNNRLATQGYLKGINVHADWPLLYDTLAEHLERLGRLDEGLAWARKGDEINTEPFKNLLSIRLLVQLDQQEAAVQAIAQIDPQHRFKAMLDAYALLFEADPMIAMTALESSFAGVENLPYPVMRARSDIAMLTGDLERINRYAVALDPQLVEEDARVEAMNAHLALKLAYVWLRNGEQKRATKLVEKTLESLAGEPRLGLTGYGIRDVQALALLGRDTEAISAFTAAVAEGFLDTLPFDGWTLEFDPFLEAIRDHPDYLAQLKIVADKKNILRERVAAVESEQDWQSLRDITRGG